MFAVAFLRKLILKLDLHQLECAKVVSVDLDLNKNTSISYSQLVLLWSLHMCFTNFPHKSPVYFDYSEMIYTKS